MRRTVFATIALVLVGFSMTTIQAGQAGVRQLGQWTYLSDGRAFYPGLGRINLVVTCPQVNLAAVTITVDNGLFETGTVLAEWDGGGEVQIYNARVLEDGRSLGLASDEFISSLRTRNRLNIGVYIQPNVESYCGSRELARLQQCNRTTAVYSMNGRPAVRATLRLDGAACDAQRLERFLLARSTRVMVLLPQEEPWRRIRWICGNGSCERGTAGWTPKVSRRNTKSADR